MATATYEIINGLLFITGSLDRASDQDFTTALEKYAESTPADKRVVDMSNVRWLAPTSAKVLISAGQDAAEKKGQMRVLASRHVLQTLNLLGAKSWLAIESCMTPNPKPNAEVAPPPPPPAPAPAPAAPVAPAVAPTVEAVPSPAPAAPAPAAPAVVSTPPGAASSILRATEVSPSSAGLTAVRPGALAGPAEELSGGAHLLRVLHSGRRYSFHFTGGDLILGIVRERIGGSWIMVETAGTRKIVNLDVVQYVEVL